MRRKDNIEVVYRGKNSQIEIHFFVVVVLIFLCFFTILGIAIPCFLSVPSEKGGYHTISSGNDIYKMVDNYLSPNEFSDVSSKKENIKMLADFYNKLEESAYFDVLSIFNQAIYVNDFKGDSQFYYSENYERTNIKSLQMNKCAYDFYNVKADGTIKWQNVQYQNENIPVLLGANYKKYYQKGDIITGQYYIKPVVFEVVGFLNRNSTLNYNHIMDINLDTYMIIPYPKKLWIPQKEFRFESMLYFNMINCDIVSKVEETRLFEEIKKISEESGFDGFSLVGLDSFQVQNMQLLVFVKRNQKIIFLILFVMVILLISIATWILQCRIKSEFRVKIQKNIIKEYRECFIYYIGIPSTLGAAFGIFFSIVLVKKVIWAAVLIAILCWIVIQLCSYFLGKIISGRFICLKKV